MQRPPRAFLLTWTLRGSWPHGDDRLSVDRRHSSYRSSKLAPRHRPGATNLPVHTAPKMTRTDRDAVEAAMETTCRHRGWTLHAVHARSNHVHVVASGPVKPEAMMQHLKAWATRALRNLDADRWSGDVWTRHGSTKYLWDDNNLIAALKYVLEEQDRPERYER